MNSISGLYTTNSQRKEKLVERCFEEDITEFFDTKLLDFFKTKKEETDNNLILIFAPYKKDLLNLRKVLKNGSKTKNWITRY